MILATYFPSRMSYNTIQSSSLLDTAFSPSGLKSTQLTFSAFSRYILATLKLRKTLSVIFMSAASLFFMQMNKNLKAALLLASPGPLRVWFNDACESMHEQYHLWPPVRDKSSHFLKKTINKIRSGVLFTNGTIQKHGVKKIHSVLTSSSTGWAVFSNQN